MTKGTFNKVGKSEQTLFGPRAMLVCGYSPEEQQTIMQFIETIRIKNIPVIFTTKTDGTVPLKDLLARPDQSGRNMESELERSIILSGVTEKELHKTLSSYREISLPHPLWATLTPISQTWPLSFLIDELKKERIAMERRKKP